MKNKHSLLHSRPQPSLSRRKLLQQNAPHVIISATVVLPHVLYNAFHIFSQADNDKWRDSSVCPVHYHINCDGGRCQNFPSVVIQPFPTFAVKNDSKREAFLFKMLTSRVIYYQQTEILTNHSALQTPLWQSSTIRLLREEGLLLCNHGAEFMCSWLYRFKALLREGVGGGHMRNFSHIML